MTTPITVAAASGTSGGEGRAVALQPDGSIVVAATAKGVLLVPPGPTVVNLSEAQVHRYADDGTVDATFGNGGLVALHNSLTSTATADAVVVNPDGKLVAAGRHTRANHPQSHFVVRLTSAGNSDASFTSDQGSPTSPVAATRSRCRPIAS